MSKKLQFIGAEPVEIKKINIHKKSNTYKIDKFMTGLIGYFNDVNSIYFLYKNILDHYNSKTKKYVFNEYRHIKIINYCYRVLFSHLYEFLVFIDENCDCLKSEDFNNILNKLNDEETKKYFKVEIFDLIKKNEKGEKTEKYAMYSKIRNRISFHYDNMNYKKIYNSVDSFKLLISLGNTNMDTEFFYMEQKKMDYMEAEFKKHNQTMQNLVDDCLYPQKYILGVLKVYFKDKIINS